MKLNSAAVPATDYLRALEQIPPLADSLDDTLAGYDAVVDGPGKFIMLRWDVGNAEDTELRPVDPPLPLDLTA